MSNVQVLNDQTKNGEKWGVSFDGNNPKLVNYVECASEEDAFKLQKLLKK